MPTFLLWLLRSSREGPLCLHPLEGVPGAFVSDASPVSRALLVLCVSQGISASFSLLLSYLRLHTTRFQSIKGPQHKLIIISPRKAEVFITYLKMVFGKLKFLDDRDKQCL